MSYETVRDEVEGDDPLPTIEGLQIQGQAAPGQEIQACGYSINGTTSCKFKWLRGSEDGSMNYIEGADQPVYKVNGDDIDLYLALEVQPIDDLRNKKGKVVRLLANNGQKIAMAQ